MSSLFQGWINQYGEVWRLPHLISGEPPAQPIVLCEACCDGTGGEAAGEGDVDLGAVVPWHGRCGAIARAKQPATPSKAGRRKRVARHIHRAEEIDRTYNSHADGDQQQEKLVWVRRLGLRLSARPTKLSLLFSFLFLLDYNSYLKK